MSDSEYERAVLWVPDPTSQTGWIRRKVWTEEPKRKKPPMGFGFAARRRESTDEQQQRAA